MYCRTPSASTAPRTPRRTCCPHAPGHSNRSLTRPESPQSRFLLLLPFFIFISLEPGGGVASLACPELPLPLRQAPPPLWPTPLRRAPGDQDAANTSQKCAGVQRRARIQGSWTLVSLNSRLEINKSEEGSGCARIFTGVRFPLNLPSCGMTNRERPHGGVRLFYQTSTCITQQTLGTLGGQMWSRITPELRGHDTFLSCRVA